MWKELKRLSGWDSANRFPTSAVDSKGQEVTGQEVLKVWEEAYKNLGLEDFKDKKFDVEFAHATHAQLENFEHISPEAVFNPHLDGDITSAEVHIAIEQLHLAKAGGEDEVVAEILRMGGESVERVLHRLCQKAWELECQPEAWTKGIIFPLYKDGDDRDPLNYRGITLLSIVGKVFTNVLNNRLIKWSEENRILVEEQGGFRPERGCPDQIFILTETLRARRQQKTFCCFIDVKKAFDRVFRDGLWVRAFEEGVQGKMWRVLKSIYAKVQSCVSVNGRTRPGLTSSQVFGKVVSSLRFCSLFSSMGWQRRSRRQTSAWRWGLTCSAFFSTPTTSFLLPLIRLSYKR